MTFGQATGTVDDFAINLQLCNEGIDLQKVDIPGVLLQMQRLRSCLGRESELTACLRRLKLQQLQTVWHCQNSIMVLTVTPLITISF
jgi:hypothetical protein